MLSRRYLQTNPIRLMNVLVIGFGLVLFTAACTSTHSIAGAGFEPVPVNMSDDGSSYDQAVVIDKQTESRPYCVTDVAVQDLICG